jgi:hypothetical protein
MGYPVPAGKTDSFGNVRRLSSFDRADGTTVD